VKAKVYVTLKPSILDPQGKTIASALQTLGYGSVRDVRQGKYFELDINAPTIDQARSLAGEVADRLLANPVIESYRVEVGQEPVATRGAENGRGPAWRGATREEG